MCTLSFIPHTNGYAVGMNRDELRSRPRALAPGYFECNRSLSDRIVGGHVGRSECLWPVVCSPELVLCRRSYVYGKGAVARRDNPANDFRLRFSCRAEPGVT